jgi:uncharacterized protein
VAERTEYPSGTPCWVDLSSPQIERSIHFYGSLFGWDTHEPGPPEETGGYTMFTLSGKQVAAIAPTQNEDQPPWWNSYVCVDSADAIAKKVRGAGGDVLMQPFDVISAGRMAIFADPQGAILCAWEPREHLGAELVNEPGSFSWTELATRDTDAARLFYESVFGWQARRFEEWETGEYTLWHLGNDRIGGMVRMDERWPAGIPDHWMVYFAVEDPDATACRVEELGGKVSVEPTDTPLGRFAVLTDPHGASFSIISPSHPALSEHPAASA